MGKLILNTSKYCHVLAKEEIIFCEISNGLVRIYLTDKKVVSTRITLLEIFDDLGQEDFVLPHRSYIINMKHVKSLHTSKDYYAEMNGDYLIPVSKSRIGHVRQLINKNHRISI